MNLLPRNRSRNASGPHHRRRTFWVEDEGHWSILLADDADLSERCLRMCQSTTLGSDASPFSLTTPEGYGGESWEDPETQLLGLR